MWPHYFNVYNLIINDRSLKMNCWVVYYYIITIIEWLKLNETTKSQQQQTESVLMHKSHIFSFYGSDKDDKQQFKIPFFFPFLLFISIRCLLYGCMVYAVCGMRVLCLYSVHVVHIIQVKKKLKLIGDLSNYCVYLHFSWNFITESEYTYH